MKTSFLLRRLFSVMSRRDITLGKAILFLLTLAYWKETLETASWVTYTIIIEETDYRVKLSKK